jgi:hypothetical protein
LIDENEKLNDTISISANEPAVKYREIIHQKALRKSVNHAALEVASPLSLFVVY